MNAARCLVGILASVGASAHAAPQTIWYALPAALTYKDARFECVSKTMVGNNLYLAVKLDGDRLVDARLKAGPASLPLHEYVFSTEELAAQKLTKDADGRVWFSELVLSERLAKGAFYWWTWMGCGVGGPVQTIEGAPLRFSYQVVPLKPWQKMPSNEISFRGTRGDGRAFNATLLIGQGALQMIP